MDTKKLFAEIDSLNQKYIDFLKDVVLLESPSGDKAAVDACGKYFTEKAKELGFKVETAPMEKAGDAICITMNENAPGKPVCFSGHIDTVHPIGFFGKDPVKIEGDIMHGPGTGDCKGGVVAGFMAMEALKNCGFTGRPVKLILQTDEEVSSALSEKGTVKFMYKMAKGSVAFLNLEPSHSPRDVVIERKGIAKYCFTVKGISSHASVCFNGKSASAIGEAANLILKIEKYKNREGITGNVGIIKGGTAINTVPSECEFFVDFRFKTEEQLKEIHDFAKEISENPTIKGTTCTAVQKSLRVSMPKCDRNIELLNKVNAILENAGMETLVEKVTFGGSDAADMTTLGLAVLDQLGTISEGAHTINETTDLSSLSYCAKRAAAIAANIE